MLPPLEVERKNGSEQFHNSGASLDFNILSFWSWAASDLASNNLRGHLAEYLVARDLGIGHGRRTEWDNYDICTLSDIKIEVKSAAYIQTWQQKKLSQITFGIAPTFGWDAINQRCTNTLNCSRKSDAFVFCLLKHKDKNTFDPTNLEQWLFFVLTTSTLNEKLGDQKTLSLNKLLSLNPVECTYGNIRASLTKLLGREL